MTGGARSGGMFGVVAFIAEWPRIAREFMDGRPPVDAELLDLWRQFRDLQDTLEADERDDDDKWAPLWALEGRIRETPAEGVVGAVIKMRLALQEIAMPPCAREDEQALSALKELEHAAGLDPDPYFDRGLARWHGAHDQSAPRAGGSRV